MIWQLINCFDNLIIWQLINWFDSSKIICNWYVSYWLSDISQLTPKAKIILWMKQILIRWSKKLFVEARTSFDGEYFWLRARLGTSLSLYKSKLIKYLTSQIFEWRRLCIISIWTKRIFETKQFFPINDFEANETSRTYKNVTDLRLHGSKPL